MTEEQILALNYPAPRKKRTCLMDDWLNVIFKMMADGYKHETIYFYILNQPQFNGTKASLQDYIYLIGKNNFPNVTPFNARFLTEWCLPPDVITINRRDLLKYLLTCNEKTKKDETIDQYVELIKNHYPAAVKVEQLFKDFHSILMGGDTSKLDEYVEKHEESQIKSFCIGIKNDITSVKNAISSPVSSGFVEGNNNKFKVIKRIVYGRSGLENLTKKCKLAFMPKGRGFSLAALL